LDRIKVGFKAFDLHELLLYMIATRMGIFERKHLQLDLKDSAFTQDEALRFPDYMVACGSSLLARLKGVPWKILFVATDYPMFWIYAKERMSALEDLRGKKVASYPQNAPPGMFLRIVLRNAAMNPDTDISIEPVHDDFTRLGLLKTGQVDAAILSSAFAPGRVQRMGMKRVCAIGDFFRIPTTGLAVLESRIEERPDEVKRMVRAFLDGLRELSMNKEAAINSIADLTSEPIEAAAETYSLVSPLFSRDGRSGREVTTNALKSVAEELSIRDIPAVEQVYDFSLQSGP